MQPTLIENVAGPTSRQQHATVSDWRHARSHAAAGLHGTAVHFPPLVEKTFIRILPVVLNGIVGGIRRTSVTGEITP
jgi:hypothetical protein